jgi:hypothetical protein
VAASAPCFRNGVQQVAFRPVSRGEPGERRSDLLDANLKRAIPPGAGACGIMGEPGSAGLHRISRELNRSRFLRVPLLPSHAA